MAKTAAQRLLAAVRHGNVPLEAAIESLLEAAQDGLADATLDHDRRRRLGHPEVVFGQGKTPAQIEAIVTRLIARGGPVLVTRAEPAARARLAARFKDVHVHETARTVRIGPAPRPRGRVAVVAAGTADLPVADEAIETLTALGSRADRVADVGVAGLHRLVARMPLLKRARVVVVVAGMEGALPSVVQGLLDRPVVAVPTSVGYGAHFRGLAPLLAMLNSCAPGITVVNVDNGFGAGYAAHLINVTGLPRPRATAMKLAFIDAFSGVSGDMTLGALVDLGFAFDELAALPAALGLEGVRIGSKEVRRGPFRARQVDVTVEGTQPHRHLRHIREILERGERGALPAPVAERALAVFTRLAEAEGRVHGEPPEKVHFHEVGAADAIVDIAGACLGFHRLGVEVIYSSPLAVGSGTVTAAHGVLPVPAPATALLLAGAPIDLAALSGERTTPTGAALVMTLARSFDPPPPFRLLAQGIGAGGDNTEDRPNVLRILLGETGGAPDRRVVAVVETTLDDASPQVIAHVTQRLLETGARDAFVTPVQMKKGRPGVTVTALCDPALVDAIADLLFRETPTIGLRVRHEERRELAREEAVVRLPEGEVRLKVVTLPDGTRRARPEYESLAALARTTGASLEALAARALAAFDAQP